MGLIALDQAVKFWVLYVFNLPARLTEPVIGPFSLTMVMNSRRQLRLTADQDLTRWRSAPSP